MSIENLTRQFESHSTQVVALAKDVKGIESSLEGLLDRVAALTVGGGGDAPQKGSRSAELKALAAFARGDEGPLRQIHASAGMSTDDDTAGGYFVVPMLSDGITKKLHDAVVMRRLARVETITSGNVWREPLDIGDVVAVWVGERQERPTTDGPDLAMLEIPLREIYASPIVTQNLLDDVGFDLGGWLEAKISDRFGRSEDQRFIGGDGILSPRGFLTYPTSVVVDATRPWGTLQHVATGAAADFATSDPADCLKTLAWAVRAPYRQGSSWLMNSNTAAKIDKFKNGDGEYIWRTGMTAGVPPTMFGYPVEFSESMPDVGAGAYPIGFGNWKLAYTIIDRVGLRLQRDPFTNKPNVSFDAFKRVGGGMANFEAIKLLKVAVS